MQSTEKVLFDVETIQQRVRELAAEISDDYDDLVCIVVLKGAMFFASDLLRSISVKTEIDTISLGSYGQKGTKSGAVRLNNDITVDIEGRDVVIIEDIIDTGYTMRYLSGLFSYRDPASIKICSLLSKPSKRKTEVKIDYLGFEIEDHWVVGYGLDYREQYRALPHIAILE